MPRPANRVVEFTLTALPSESPPAGLTAPAEEEVDGGLPFALTHLPGSPSAGPAGAGGPGPHFVLLPPDWAVAVAEVEEAAAAGRAGRGPPAVVAVVGPKHAGKSSMGRRLVNRLLSQHPVVGYLDTDVGQPELTPPGLVSLALLTQPLLGLPCTHLLPHVTRSHYVVRMACAWVFRVFFFLTSPPGYGLQAHSLVKSMHDLSNFNPG